MKFIFLFTIASALGVVSAAPAAPIASPIAIDVAVDMTQAETGDHLFKRRTCPPFLLRAQKTGVCTTQSQNQLEKNLMLTERCRLATELRAGSDGRTASAMWANA